MNPIEREQNRQRYRTSQIDLGRRASNAEYFRLKKLRAVEAARKKAMQEIFGEGDHGRQSTT